MLDVYHTIPTEIANYQEFLIPSVSHQWLKPRGVAMAFICVIGAGAGGRAGTSTTGGAGGGSGSVECWCGPVIFLPDALAITIGKGGASNSAGTNTTVDVWTNSSTKFTLFTGAGAPSNTGGSLTSTNFMSSYGLFTTRGGQAGGAADTSVVYPTGSSVPLTGGAGGSSTASVAGGSVTPAQGYPILTSSTSAPASDGFFFRGASGFVAAGGAGGGAGASTGNAGGAGGLGCGGGGGSRVSAAGGKGGDGAVFIWAW